MGPDPKARNALGRRGRDGPRAAHLALIGPSAQFRAHRLTGPDRALRARVMAATFLTTLRVAVQHWIDDPQGSLPSVISTALAAAAPRQSGG